MQTKDKALGILQGKKGNQSHFIQDWANADRELVLRNVTILH